METAVRGDSKSDSLLFPSLIVCLFQSCSSYCDLRESQNILFFSSFFSLLFLYRIHSGCTHMVTDFWKSCGQRCSVHLWHNWKQGWIRMNKLLVCVVCSMLMTISENVERFYHKKNRKQNWNLCASGAECLQTNKSHLGSATEAAF